VGFAGRLVGSFNQHSCSRWPGFLQKVHFLHSAVPVEVPESLGSAWFFFRFLLDLPPDWDWPSWAFRLFPEVNEADGGGLLAITAWPLMRLWIFSGSISDCSIALIYSLR